MTEPASEPGVRERAPYGPWRMWSRAAAAPLHGAVRRPYTGFTVTTGVPDDQPVLPVPSVTVVLSFGDPLRVAGPATAGPASGTVVSFAAGLHDAPGRIAHDGSQAGVQVDLSPLAAGRLLGAPAGTFAGVTIDLDDLLGGAGRELVARLAEAGSWTERFDLLDAVLTARLSRSRTGPAPEVAAAWRRLRRTRGRVTVADLAEETGWSRRHLSARFRAEIGLTPKTAARVLRFRHAYGLLATGARSYTDVAVASGYYDHAHLDREFRALAGTAPSALPRPPAAVAPSSHSSKPGTGPRS